MAKLTIVDTREAGESPEKLQQAFRLLGNKVRFNHMPPGTGRICTKINSDGMVEVEGMAGRFASHLFEIDGEVSAVAVLGKVN